MHAKLISYYYAIGTKGMEGVYPEVKPRDLYICYVLSSLLIALVACYRNYLLYDFQKVKSKQFSLIFYGFVVCC